MKILVICQYYYPEEFQINDICEGLSQRGHKITVLTGLPNYPTGVIPQDYKNGHKRDEIINGVHVIRASEIPRRKGIIGLGMNYISYVIFASLKALRLQKNFDVVYVYQLSPVFMAVPGIILKKILKKKLYLYCCDLWPESVKAMHIKNSSFIFKIVKCISSFIYRKCDCIGVQAIAFYEYFTHTHKIPINKLQYIPQFAKSDYLNEQFAEEHKSINLVFMGNIGWIQDLDCLVAAAKINKKIGIKYLVHIVGDGSYLNELKNIVRQSELDDYFMFYGRKPSTEMPRYYKLADACILTLKGDNVIGQTIPSKLQGYMAAGKFVLAAINGSAQAVINDAGCGLVVNASDAEAFADIIGEFVKNKARYVTHGLEGRRYFQAHFTKDKYLDATEKILQRLASI